MRPLRRSFARAPEGARRRVSWLLAAALWLPSACFQPFGPFDPDAGDPTEDDPAQPPDAALVDRNPGVVPNPAPNSGPNPAPDSRPTPVPTPVRDAGVAVPAPGAGVPALDAGLPLPFGDLASCAQLSGAACARSMGCVAVEAYAIDPMLGCSTGKKHVGCGPGLLCSASFGSTYANDASGGLWLVNNNCIPDGFRNLPQQPFFPSNGACPGADIDPICRAVVDEAACITATRWGCVPIRAGRLDPMRRCVEAGAYAGCMANKPCEAGVALFRDLRGGLWLTTTPTLACLPTGFEFVARDGILALDAGVTEFCRAQP